MHVGMFLVIVPVQLEMLRLFTLKLLEITHDHD